jgi:hypothetical protein
MCLSVPCFFQFTCMSCVCVVEMVVFVQSNLWSFPATWFAGEERGSCRLMAFLCSVMRDLTVFLCLADVDFVTVLAWNLVGWTYC